MRGRIVWGIAGAVLLAVVGAGIALRDPARTDPRALLGQIHEAVEARRWDHAEGLLDRLATLQEPGIDEQLLRAEIANGRGQPDAALAILETIPDAGAARARLYSAQIERNRKRMRHAEAYLLDAVRLDPQLVQARRELIYLYGMQTRREALSEQFRALAGLRPLDQNELMMWTASHEDIWVNTSIKSDLESFLNADPDDRWSRLALAQVHLAQGRLDNAAEVLAPLPNSDIEALALRVQIALDRAQLDEARGLLAKAPTEHARLARLRGQLAVRLKDPASAVEAYRTAVALAPTSRESLQGLALTLALSGDEEAAAGYTRQAAALREVADLLDRVRALDGQVDPALPARLGAACETAGLLDEARGWYKLAITIAPLNSDAQHALYRLREPPP